MEVVNCRLAELSDLEALLRIENTCFLSDKLTRRSMRRWLQVDHGVLVVAEQAGALLAYGLLWCHRGTRLARLYSLACLPEARGRGIAQTLLVRLEEEALKRGRLYMRLEVSKKNAAAINLYKRMGYLIFGEFSDYYEDHSDALRMHKTIRCISQAALTRSTPWYEQTTDFTCGPAALIMAMESFNGEAPSRYFDQTVELDIWRQATSIFMTSGHGGCHPLGLALAASDRGFHAEVWINTPDPLFLDGVRTDVKKKVLAVVHAHFLEQVRGDDLVSLVFDEINQQQISTWLRDGYAVIVLISTYHFDGKKAPHWVTVTGMDDECLYVHDPDPSEQDSLAIDCQYLPVAREDFDKVAVFGSSRLKTAVAIRPR